MNFELHAGLQRILERLLDVKARGYQLVQLSVIAEDLKKLIE